MTGIVLCGGNSTRMGSDKGLLKAELVTWAELAAQKFTACGLPWVVSINPSQFEAYEQIFPAAKLVVDRADISVRGPLLGLLSVHRQLPAEDLVVLACDLKEMTTGVLQNLCTFAAKTGNEALVYTTSNKPQPLCGFYSAAGMDRVYKLAEAGDLKRFSMMYVLELLNAERLPVKDEDLPAFTNFNEPEEPGPTSV